MFIQTEETPNPRTLKFLPGKTVLSGDTATFLDKEMAKKSPLAERLFDVSEVESVFFGQDFITVTKTQDADWQVIKPLVLTTIMEHYIAQRPIFHGMESDAEHQAATEESFDEKDADIVKEIKELLDSRVRPAVAEDGGDIIFSTEQVRPFDEELTGFLWIMVGHQGFVQFVILDVSSQPI